MRRFSCLFLAVIVFLFLFQLTGCTEPDGQDDSSSAAPPAGGPAVQPLPDDSGAIDDDTATADDDGIEESDPYEPPLGTNPALGYGPYKVRRELMQVPDDVQPGTAYVYVPDVKGPLPTLVWGHGIWAADWPQGQAEMFYRLASRGFLVVYPNMEVPFPSPADDTVMKGVTVYLNSARRAVHQGLADPDHMVFGGYSFGARVAVLATAMTSGMDPFNFWPDPVSCVYEALPDFSESWYIDFPGPRPSEWAPYINPEIDQTFIAAENDFVVPNYDAATGVALNGAYLYEIVPANFAQLIILQSGSTIWDRATHNTYLAPTQGQLDDYDLWGHIKIVAGIMQYRFHGHSKEWAYGFMRAVGGLDHAGKAIFHEVFNRGELYPHPGDDQEYDEEGFTDQGDGAGPRTN